MRKQIIKNVGSNYISTAIGMALGLFLIPFLIHKLGKEAFGIIVLAESTIAFFEVATVGVRMALSRYAAFALAKGDKKEFSEYLSTGCVVLFLTAILVFISAFFLSVNFPVIFKVPQGLASQSRVLFLFITVAFTLSIPNIVFWSVLYAKQRFDLINVSLFFGLVSRALGLFALYSILPARYVSLGTYGLVYLLMTLLQNLLIYYWQKKVMPGNQIRFQAFRLDKVGEILSFSFHTSVSRVSSLLSGNSLDILINLFWGPAFNTIYSIGFKFPTLMNRLFQDATWTLTPSFTELAAKNERERLKRLLFAYTKLIAILVVPLGLLLAWLAQPLIRLWVGEGFELAAKILSISAIPLVTAIPFAVVGCIAMAYGKVKVPSQVGLVVAILNVGAAMLLGKGFSQGLEGIAIASAAASIFYYTVFSPYYACRIAEISLGEYWMQAFLKPFIWSIFVVGTAFLALKVVGRDRPVTALVMAALLTLVPLISYIGAYFIVLDPQEKLGINEILKKVTESFHAVFKKQSVRMPRLS